MMRRGERVSRRVVARLEHAFPDRARHRRGELRALAAMVAAAFEAEAVAIDRAVAMLPLLARAASAAANTHNPHSRETGRFVPRRPAKTPLLTERDGSSSSAGAPGRKKRRKSS
jgi:hypothetical protein